MSVNGSSPFLKEMLIVEDLRKKRVYINSEDWYKLLEHLKKMERSDIILGCLEADGVDNWCGYSDAMTSAEEALKENDQTKKS